MADSTLVFERPGAASASLVFGDDIVAGITDMAITGTLPGLVVAVRLGPPRDMVLTGVFPALSVLAAVSYHSNTERPMVNDVAAPWQEAADTQVQVDSGFQTAAKYTAGVQAPADDAAPLPTFLSGAWADASKMRVGQHVAFDDGIAARVPLHGLLQDGEHVRPVFTDSFQDGYGRRNALSGYFQDGDSRRNDAAVRFQNSRPHFKSLRTTGGYARPSQSGRASRFQDAQRAPAGLSAVPTVPVTPPRYWSAHLLFACPPLAAPHLVFGLTQCTDPVTPGAFYYILPARFYMTAHTIYAQRLPDLADVPIFDATVSADSGSYCWTLSANGPQSLFAQLAPVDGLPVQLRLTLDGIPWVFAVDAMGRTSAFGKTGVRISGRSVTALIGAPYLRATTRSNTQERQAQQLALDALQDSGVDLDWGLTDWLVPTAAWSHQGTPLDAVQAIAQAAGGYLQSHRSAATLLTRHPYSQRTGDNPGAPWGWMTGPADVELAPDAIITEGVDRRDGPDINAVYVSGTTQGVLAQVKRTGSAGDKLAAMVTDALITDAVVARQRGLAILGTAGPQYNVRMDLPVLTGVGQPGVLDVGQLVQINATVPWRGRVRAVSVAAKSPSLRQSITLERHL